VFGRGGGIGAEVDEFDTIPGHKCLRGWRLARKAPEAGRRSGPMGLRGLVWQIWWGQEVQQGPRVRLYNGYCPCATCDIHGTQHPQGIKHPTCPSICIQAMTQARPTIACTSHPTPLPHPHLPPHTGLSRTAWRAPAPARLGRRWGRPWWWRPPQPPSCRSWSSSCATGCTGCISWTKVRAGAPCSALSVSMIVLASACIRSCRGRAGQANSMHVVARMHTHLAA
jgi:hypothetical protein